MTDLPSHEIARRELAVLIKAKGGTMECTPLLARPDAFDVEWSKTAIHRQCRLTIGGIEYVTTYSAGRGIIEGWAEKSGGWVGMELRRLKREYGKKWQTLSATEEVLGKIYARWNPNITDVCSSLLMESPEPGQAFEEWAADYGYDSDSRKALATFEACQKSGQFCRKAFGPDFDRAKELAHEM